MRRVVFAACVACLMHTRIAHGQSITEEATATGGYSTDDVSAAGAQFRVYGPFIAGVSQIRTSPTETPVLSTRYQ